MKTSAREANNDPNTVPAGFVLEPQGDDAFLIHHKRTGMGCMNIFLIVWLAGWTVGCVGLLRSYLRRETMEEVNPPSLLFVMGFCVVDILVAILFIYMLFCRTMFLLDRENLIMERDVLGFKRRKTIPRGSIQKVIQVKDGGEEEDSFPSWGLKVEGDKNATLIFRQPHEKSRWLGRILAQWAGVEFVEAPEK